MEGDAYHSGGECRFRDILVHHVMDFEPFPWKFQNEDHPVDKQDNRSSDSDNRYRLVGTGTFQCHLQGTAGTLI